MQEKPARRSNRERTEETRAALLAAGRSLFIEKGYAETGTPEIVKAANVTRGALYHHFRDKEDLFRTIVEREAHAVSEEIERRATGAVAPLTALKEGSSAYFDAMAVPGRARLLLLDGPAVLGPKEMSRIDKDAGGGTLLEGLAALLGKPPDRDVQALAEMLSAAFDRAALAIAFGASRTEYETAMRELLDGLVRTGHDRSANGNPG